MQFLCLKFPYGPVEQHPAKSKSEIKDHINIYGRYNKAVVPLAVAAFRFLLIFFTAVEKKKSGNLFLLQEEFQWFF